jgi:hypothetical protein
MAFFSGSSNPTKRVFKRHVFKRRLVWALGLSALLLLETLAFVVLLVVGGRFVASLNERGMLGITALDVACWLGIFATLEMSLVGLVVGWFCAGGVPVGFDQERERALWLRAIKTSAFWCAVGIVSIPLWFCVLVCLAPNFYVFCPFPCAVVTFAGIRLNLRVKKQLPSSLS